MGWGLVGRGTGKVTSDLRPEWSEESEEASQADIWGKNVPERTCRPTGGRSWCVWGTQGGGLARRGPLRGQRWRWDQGAGLTLGLGVALWVAHNVSPPGWTPLPAR